MGLWESLLLLYSFLNNYVLLYETCCCEKIHLIFKKRKKVHIFTREWFLLLSWSKNHIEAIESWREKKPFEKKAPFGGWRKKKHGCSTLGGEKQEAPKKGLKTKGEKKKENFWRTFFVKFQVDSGCSSLGFFFSLISSQKRISENPTFHQQKRPINNLQWHRPTEERERERTLFLL